MATLTWTLTITLIFVITLLFVRIKLSVYIVYTSQRCKLQTHKFLTCIIEYSYLLQNIKLQISSKVNIIIDYLRRNSGIFYNARTANRKYWRKFRRSNLNRYYSVKQWNPSVSRKRSSAAFHYTPLRRKFIIPARNLRANFHLASAGGRSRARLRRKDKVTRS